MMRNESLDKDFARFLRTETKSFTAELLRVDKNPDPFSPRDLCRRFHSSSLRRYTESDDKEEGSVDEEIENVESEAEGDVEKEAGPKMKAGPFASETKGNGLEAGPCDTKTELGRNEADGNATTETVQVFLKSDNLESNVCSGLVNDVENGFGLNLTKSVGEERKRFEYREHESEDASKVFVKMFKPNIQEAALSPRGDMKDKENLAHQVFDGFTKQNLSL
ncbi:hypothetical protein U1Q18_040592 [Sarracenia purpurea var. burkii]